MINRFLYAGFAQEDFFLQAYFYINKIKCLSIYLMFYGKIVTGITSKIRQDNSF